MKNDKKIKIGFVSLGCSKNLVDTEVMLAKLVAAGYEITPEDTEADVIIVNTCGFIEDAKREAIDNILEVAQQKQPSDDKTRRTSASPRCKSGTWCSIICAITIANLPVS